jgi:hypothetical protein
VAVFYPLVYWLLMSVITVVSTPRGLFGKGSRGPTLWKIPREPLAREPAAGRAVSPELVQV